MKKQSRGTNPQKSLLQNAAVVKIQAANSGRQRMGKIQNVVQTPKAVRRITHKSLCRRVTKTRSRG